MKIKTTPNHVAVVTAPSQGAVAADSARVVDALRDYFVRPDGTRPTCARVVNMALREFALTHRIKVDG